MRRIKDAPEPPDVVAQCLFGSLLEAIEVKDGRRVWHRTGPRRLTCPALHFFTGATPGVGALTSGLAGWIHGPLAMGILSSFLLWGCRCRGGGSAGVGRGRTHGSVTVVSIVQQVFQACDPCPRTGIALALLWWEGEKRSGRAQCLFQPPASLS